MAQVVRGVMGLGLVLGVGALPVAAQSMALPAADPVGIARSGAQVAFGYSLEAASLNPALLASLKEKYGAYFSIGVEAASAQQSLESNQKSYFSNDENRGLVGLGLAMRVSPKLSLGLKMDEPFLRHSQLVADAPSRYLGDGIDVHSVRLEGQAAWTVNPNLSIGLGLGAARLSYDSSSLMRLNVPVDPTLPVSSTNAVDGLVEHRIGQRGDKVVPSYSLGVRWAISPRWTLGFVHQSGLKGDLGMQAEYRDAPLGYYANDGLSTAPLGTATRATTLLGVSAATVGSSATMELPSQTTLGMRQRVTPMVTWEADLRWTSGSMRMPSFAMVQTPSGPVLAPTELPQGQGYLSLLASAEFELGKVWTLRAGAALTQRSVAEATLEPLLGGTSTSAFSIGAGYKAWGGELNFGYQYRQSQDQDRSQLSGTWSSTGFHPSPTRVRVEGMGHLLALGFKKTF